MWAVGLSALYSLQKILHGHVFGVSDPFFVGASLRVWVHAPRANLRLLNGDRFCFLQSTIYSPFSNSIADLTKVVRVFSTMKARYEGSVHYTYT